MFIQLRGSTKTKRDDKGPVPRFTDCTNMHPKGLREWERLQTFDWGCMWDVWSWESDHYLARSNLAPEMMATNKVLLKYEMQEILYSSHGKPNPFFWWDMLGYAGSLARGRFSVVCCFFQLQVDLPIWRWGWGPTPQLHNTTDAKKHW